MKFLVFGGERFYASGGWNDFIGEYETLKRAVEVAKDLMGYYVVERHIEWWHVAHEGQVLATCYDDEHQAHTDSRRSVWEGCKEIPKE